MYLIPLILSASVIIHPTDYKDWLDDHLAPSEAMCAKTLWTRESNMDPHAINDMTGAYGIPQALPGAKMASAGKDWQNNGVTQMRWGISYSLDRYGSICGALYHSNLHGWY